jgi:hypothetical protein
MNINNVISWRINRLTKQYLDRLAQDMNQIKPSHLLNKIVSELFIIKYGEEEAKKLRREYFESKGLI